MYVVKNEVIERQTGLEKINPDCDEYRVDLHFRKAFSDLM